MTYRAISLLGHAPTKQQGTQSLTLDTLLKDSEVLTPHFMPSFKKALPPSLYIEDFIEEDETENEELVDLELKAMVLRLRNDRLTD